MNGTLSLPVAGLLSGFIFGSFFYKVSSRRDIPIYPTGISPRNLGIKIFSANDLKQKNVAWFLVSFGGAPATLSIWSEDSVQYNLNCVNLKNII